MPAVSEDDLDELREQLAAMTRQRDEAVSQTVQLRNDLNKLRLAVRGTLKGRRRTD